MEIIYLENTDPIENFVGGIPTFIRNAAKYSRSQNHNITLIGSVIKDNPTIAGKYFDKIISLSNKQIGHTKFLIKLFLNFRKININKDAIIHSQRLMLCIPFLLSNKKYKIISTSHGIEKQTVAGRKGFIHGLIYEMIERFVVPKLDYLTVVDPRAEEYFKNKYPKKAENIIRIPIGINKESFYPISKEKCINKYDINTNKTSILFLGRMEYQKNLGLLLDSFKLLNNKDIELIIAGQGKLSDHYKNYCIEKDIQNVRFIGGVFPDEIVHIMNLCDLLVLSSHFEGSPTVVKEALACNLPVVSTDCGDVYEVIDGLKRCYISLKDKTDLSEKILMSLSDKKRYDYSKSIEKYTNDFLFEKLLKLYYNVKC